MGYRWNIGGGCLSDQEMGGSGFVTRRWDGDVSEAPGEGLGCVSVAGFGGCLCDLMSL